MIIGKIMDSARYVKLHAGFKEAFDFLTKETLPFISDGRHKIAGDMVYVNIAAQKGKGRKEAKLEKHSEYIDIHFVLEGEDEIGWKAFSDCKDIFEMPEQGKDAESFSDQPEFYFTLKPGEFAIFFPEDCHAPLANEKSLRKGVIKVAV